MATAKPGNQRKASRLARGRRHWRNALLAAAALLAVVVVVVLWPGQQARARLAVAYGARVACTCHYLGGRSLTDCAKDFEPGMALVRLSDNPATHTITARIPLIASQTSTFRDGTGCELQSWVP